MEREREREREIGIWSLEFRVVNCELRIPIILSYYPIILLSHYPIILLHYYPITLLPYYPITLLSYYLRHRYRQHLVLVCAIHAPIDIQDFFLSFSIIACFKIGQRVVVFLHFCHRPF